MIYHIEKKVIGKSLRTVISSEGYKKFLPPYDYLIAHNMRNLPADRVWKIQHRDTRRDILHIAFIGYVNYQEQHKKLILALKDDSRFRLSFIGTKAEELGTFCREHNVENVTLRGTFEADRILDFYRDVDMVNNLYGNHTPVLDYALSNKLYFAATLQIPILVYPAYIYGGSLRSNLASDVKCHWMSLILGISCFPIIRIWTGQAFKRAVAF